MADKLTYDQVLEEGRSLLGRDISNSDKQKIIEIYEELATKAFIDGDREIEAYCERVLYAIHCRSGFTAPLQPNLSIVWHVLMQKKLKRDLRDYISKDEISKDEMVEICSLAVEKTETLVHPFIERCGEAEDNHPLTVYTKNWFSSTHGFTNQMINLCAKVRNDLKNSVIENISEEFAESPHPERRAIWPKALGINYSPESSLIDPDQQTEAFGLQNFRTGISCLNDMSYCLGAFYSIEAVFVGVSRRLYQAGLARGFGEDKVIHFKEHAELDAEHASEWLDAVKRSDLSSKERKQVANGALSQLHQRTKMFVAMESAVFNSMRVTKFGEQGIFEHALLKDSL